MRGLRQSLREGKPFVESLSDLPEINLPEINAVIKRVNISFDLGDEDACTSNPKNA